MKADWLTLAGIQDVAGFYRDRFFTGGVLNARYFDALFRFDINLARTMWVYDNVRRGSSVLDLGCGEGVLALLKRKNVHLTGVDLSPQLTDQARRNGYDVTCVAEVTSLPFPSGAFDYVVSLDLLGHIGFDEKDVALAEIKRVLRADGVTMHGIETLNRELHGDYESMSREKLTQFVGIDGHIGLEVDDAIVARFSKLFRWVEAEPRYTLCLSVAEFIKQYDEYGVPFDKDFIDYLRGLSFDERHAFDMAMGYVFGRISDLKIQMPSSGLYMLLKASDAEPEPLYNAHRDRSDLFNSGGPGRLDILSHAAFSNGWYAANDLPPIARWMTRQSRLRFESEAFTKIRFQLTTHIPDLHASPMELEFKVNGELLCNLCLCDYGWLELEIDVPTTIIRAAASQFEVEIQASRTWQPSAWDPQSRDDRYLSIAVCGVEII